MSTTRSMYLPESWLIGLSGVKVYVYDPDERSFTLQKKDAAGAAALLFYEVSIIDSSGSWWVSTAPQSLRPLAWPLPLISLDAQGAGIWTQVYGETVLRSENLYWWLPEVLHPSLPLTAATNQGTINGSFPITAPQ